MARTITPFAPSLVHSWVDAYGDAAGGSTAGPVERWDDPTRAFRMHFLADRHRPDGVRDPLNGNDFANPAGIRIPPLHGYRNLAEYPGPRWYDPLTNPDIINIAWQFEKLFHPLNSYWPDGFQYQSDSEKDNTGGTGGERRHFIWPRLNYYMRNQGPRVAEAYQHLEAWADSTHRLRPSSHVKEASPRLWTPPTQAGYEINGGDAAHQGWNPTKQWNDSTDWNSGPDFDDDRHGKNFWDRGHMESTPQYASAVVGQRTGLVALWNLWRQVAKAWPQNSGLHTGDQLRSMGWYILLCVRSYLVGFENADATMRNEQCGGVKPSERLDRILQIALGSRFPSSDPYSWGGRDFIEVHPEYDWKCDDQGTQWCCCDANMEFDSDTGRLHYIGSDGVDYGNQCVGRLTFQLGIAYHALEVARRAYDHVKAATGLDMFSAAVRADLNLLIAHARDTVIALGVFPAWPAVAGKAAYSYFAIQQPIRTEDQFASYFAPDLDFGVPDTSPAFPAKGSGIAREIIEAGRVPCNKGGAQNASVFRLWPLDRYVGRAAPVRETNDTGTTMLAPWWAQAFGPFDPVTKALLASSEFKGRGSSKSDRDRWWTLAEVAYAAGEVAPDNHTRQAMTGRRRCVGTMTLQVHGGGGGGTTALQMYARSGHRGSLAITFRFALAASMGSKGSLSLSTSGGRFAIGLFGRSGHRASFSYFAVQLDLSGFMRSRGELTLDQGDDGGGGGEEQGQSGGGPRLRRGRLPDVISDLLPNGPAWPKSANLLRSRITRAMSDFLQQILVRGLDLLAERHPKFCNETLEDWEETLGLPDECSKYFDADNEMRRIIAHNRLTTEGSLAEAYLVAQAALIGWTITIQYNFPPMFTAGSRAGSRLTGRSSRFVFEVHGDSNQVTYFRAGVGRAGDRLVSGDDDALICLINKLKPAHTQAKFILT